MSPSGGWSPNGDRRVRTLVGIVGGALVAMIVGGCARGFTEGGLEEFGSFRIEVTNDLSPRAQIYLEPAAGDPEEERLLGDAPVEGTTTFRIDVEEPDAPVRLRALLLRGQERVSEPFVPEEVGGVRWTLTDNVLARLGADGADGADGAGAEGADDRAGDGFRRPGGSGRYPPRPRRSDPRRRARP